jgi:hypothetical protein
MAMINMNKGERGRIRKEFKGDCTNSKGGRVQVYEEPR